MTSSEHLRLRPGTTDPQNTTDAPADVSQEAPECFESILFDRRADSAAVAEATAPAFFRDLNLDQALETILAGREQYDLAPFFYAPLEQVESVGYRHEVVRDLQRPEIAEPIRRFSEQMRRMREQLVQIEKLHYSRQRQAWFRDAIELYCDGVQTLADALAAAPVTARALTALCGYLVDYVASEPFTSLAAETRARKEALAAVDYSVRTHGARVTVGRYENEPDYSAEVEQTFARFKQGAVNSYLVKLPDFADMNHVEAHILDLVAQLYPNAFDTLADYCRRHSDYLDPTIGRFDREVQFYLAYLELISRLEARGLAFCLPHLSARAGEISVSDGFDLALANKLVSDGRDVVCNSFGLSGRERIIVVSGPNNGGKTTFARMFGQLHYLASLGLPIPGSSARLLLPDQIYTHFEREENIETLRGKLEDELVRVHEILEQATVRSVIVANESFSSTTLIDSLFLGTEVLNRISELGSLAVYVTFVDELASLNDATISMVSEIVQDNPAERTYKISRRPADGLAYAAAIAAKYGLSYDRLMERIGT
jgi:DNA mismatch repair protein MutS